MTSLALPGRLTSWWNALWFARIPPDIYALLRIVIGVLGMIEVMGFTPVSLYWPLDGITPLPGGGIGLRGGLQAVGLGTVSGWIAFLGLLSAYACMALGYRTRAAIVACYVGSVLQKSWNHLPLTSANEVLIAVLFCLAWADCGAVLSLDAVRARRRASPAAPAVVRQDAAIWPLRLIQFQVALIYFNSGLWKLLGPNWRDGTAVYYAVSSNIFHRFPAPVPAELTGLLAAGTYVTLFWEIGFPLLLFNRWGRRAALLMGVAVHLGIWATMEVGLFSWLMMASYLAFLDPPAVARRLRRFVDTP